MNLTRERRSAYAVTDTPDQVRALISALYNDADVLIQVPELVSQRRRWLNGSFFAAIHSTFKFHYIYRSSHSLIFSRYAPGHTLRGIQNLSRVADYPVRFPQCNFLMSFVILDAKT